MLIDTEQTYVVIEWDDYYPRVNNIKYYGKKMDCERYFENRKFCNDPENISMLTLQEYLDGGY